MLSIKEAQSILPKMHIHKISDISQIYRNKNMHKLHINKNNCICQYCKIKANVIITNSPHTNLKWISHSPFEFSNNKLTLLNIDHFLPYSKGGANTSKNLRILCTNCNVKKKKFNN